MDNREARELLAFELSNWRRKSYSELSARIGTGPVVADVAGKSGASYQIEIEFHWDGKPNGDIRVLGAIDDGGLRAFAPLTDDFIMAPDGRLVGEDDKKIDS